MSKKTLHFFSFLLFFVSTTIAQQPSTPPKAVFHVNETGAPITPYFYGMFTELLQNMYEKGMWAEMISDRKFFYPVDTITPLTPINTKRGFNQWKPVGNAVAIPMDNTKAYTGKQSPVVRVEDSSLTGIQQSRLGFTKGKAYTGRIVLLGDPGAKVQVSLVWGEGAGDRQTVSINRLTNAYVKYPLNFVAGDSTTNGRIEITGTGSGTFHIGAVSLMPADNIKGFRKDIITLLHDLKQGVYRWPGGNFVANYDWRDGIGDIDKRSPRYDYAWNTVEYNDVGTDEFMVLCDLLKIDPYMCVNAGLGDAFSAAQWVEYCNGSKETPMGKLRTANGHAKPYAIRLWGIGNEMYGEWQIGHMSINHYVQKHNQFAEAMKAVDPTIKLVASGATPFETSMTSRHHRKPLPSRLPYEYGSLEDWSYNLLKRSADHFDYLAEHIYPSPRQAFDLDSQKLVNVNDPLEDRIRRLPNRMVAMVEAYDEYMKRMPELKSRHIQYALDEWILGGQGMEGALGAAAGLHEMFRNSGLIYLGNYTAATSCLVYNQTDAQYSDIGLVFKLYRDHFGSIPVKVSGNSPQKDVKGTVGVDKASKSSGSDTWPLDVMAALTEDKKKLTIAVINPTESEQSLQLSFDNLKLDKNVKLWQIVPPELRSQNLPGKPPVVSIKEVQLKAVPGSIKLAPASVSLFEVLIN